MIEVFRGELPPRAFFKGYLTAPDNMTISLVEEDQAGVSLRNAGKEATVDLGQTGKFKLTDDTYEYEVGIMEIRPRRPLQSGKVRVFINGKPVDAVSNGLKEIPLTGDPLKRKITVRHYKDLIIARQGK